MKKEYRDPMDWGCLVLLLLFFGTCFILTGEWYMVAVGVVFLLAACIFSIIQYEEFTGQTILPKATPQKPNQNNTDSDDFTFFNFFIAGVLTIIFMMIAHHCGQHIAAWSMAICAGLLAFFYTDDEYKYIVSSTFLVIGLTFGYFPLFFPTLFGEKETDLIGCRMGTSLVASILMSVHAKMFINDIGKKLFGRRPRR